MMTGSSSSDPASAALIIVPMLVFFAIFYVVFAIFLGMIFKKAGVESWKAWVPFYNSWVMLEIGGQKGYWILLSLIPPLGIVTLVFSILAAINIGKSLGKETWFVLIYIFLPLVWLIWLAVDKSTWVPVGSTPIATQPTYQPTTTEDTPPTPPTDQTPPTPPVNPLIQ